MKHLSYEAEKAEAVETGDKKVPERPDTSQDLKGRCKKDGTDSLIL